MSEETNEPGLSKVLELSFLNCSAVDYKDVVEKFWNFHNPAKQAVLDAKAADILDCSDWRVKLSNKDKHKSHYNQFVAFTKGGCKNGQKGSSHSYCSESQNCNECKQRRKYDKDCGKPSGLLRLIRNILAHPKQMMICFPNGVVKTVLFPKGYEDKQAFVEYWLEKFPKLFPFVAALEKNQQSLFDWSKDCVADQAVRMLRDSLEKEKSTGKLLKSYVCKLSHGKQVKLELLVGLNVQQGQPKQRKLDVVNKLVRVEDSSLTVQHGSSEPLKYPLTSFERDDSNQKTLNLINSIDLLNNENCENTDRVVLIIESSEQIDEVEKRLKNFARFKLEEELEGYVQRWLVEHEENVDAFSPRPNIMYLILADDKISQVGGDIMHLNKLIWYSKSIVEAQVVSEEKDLNGLMKIERNVVVLKKGRSNYEKYSNRFENICGERSLQLIRLQIDHEAKVSRFMFLTPQNYLTSKMSEKLVFVSAGAGEGKTTLLEHLLFTNCSLKMKVLHTTARNLMNIPKDKNRDTLEDIKCSVAPLVFESGDSVLLLIDALDEADETECIQCVRKITQECGDRPEFKIIISMRSYIEPKMRTEFPSTTIFKLAALTEDDKKSIILNYWKSTKICIDNVSGERTASDIFKTYNDNFELTPLHCKLLAEIYENQVKQSLGLLKKYSLIEIYKLIVLKNFDRYILEKKKWDKRQGQDVYQLLKEQYEFAHVYLALKQLCPQYADYLKDALQHPKIKLTPGQGFLHNIDPVVFTHRTFAEYFVDRWVFQVVSGGLNLEDDDLAIFSQFFIARYFTWDDERFYLTDMLAELDSLICFRFKLDENNIIYKLLQMSQKDWRHSSLARFFLRSLAVESRELVTKVLNESEGLVASRILDLSVGLSCYEMVHLLIEVDVTFNIANRHFVHEDFSGFIHMLSKAIKGTSVRSKLEREQKKQIVDLLITTLLHRPDVSFPRNVSHRLPDVEFDLFLYMLEKIDCQMEQFGHKLKPFLQEFLLQTNYCRENLLHINKNSPEFINGFRMKFRPEFYKLANSVTRCGKTFQSRSSLKESFNEVDYCIKDSNGDLQLVNKFTIASQISVKSCSGSNLLKILREKKEYGWNQVSLSLRDADMVGDRVSVNIKTGAFDSLLAAFRACAEIDNIDLQQIEELANSFPSCKDELSPYFVALYIKHRLRDKSASQDEFQHWLINTVLVTDGVKFKYPMCCHLLNDLIADILDNDLFFQLSEKYVKAMCVNDSSFIVACKSANVNIAKLLAKSFPMEWMSCLEDFQLMCVFRALDQHCGDLLEEIVAKLVAQNFSVQTRIQTEQESLITGNLKLFKLYVEQLGFSNIRENFHLILENSSSDGLETIKRKKDMLQYILKEFPESLSGIKCICDTVDFSTFHLLNPRAEEYSSIRLIYGVDVELVKCLLGINDCDDDANDDSDKMAAKPVVQKFPDLIQTAQEALITGNRYLFRLHVEYLGFTNVQENAHLFLANSQNDHWLVIERKKNLIDYILNEFPESLNGIQYTSDDPRLETASNDNNASGTRLICRVHLDLVKYLDEELRKKRRRDMAIQT